MNRPSAVSAASSSVIPSNGTPWVSVMNGAYRTFTTTCTTGRDSAARSSPSSRAIRTTSRSTTSQEVMFDWNVSSLPCPRAR